MRRNLLIIAAIVILIAPFLLRKKTALLGVYGGTKIVAKRSLMPDWDDGAVNVYMGKEKIFTLWEDFCDGPQFIYPFADGKRFFCDFNYDTAILDFVVDLDTSHTNLTTDWPIKKELKDYLAHSATNVVIGSNVLARLATSEELQEVRDYLSRTSKSKINASSLPYSDFGIWHGYAGKDYLLLDLATSRQNYWPMPGAP